MTKDYIVASNMIHYSIVLRSLVGNVIMITTSERR